MVLPRRVGTFLISRVAISFMDSAVSSTSVISAASVSRMLTRSLRFQAIELALLGFLDHHTVLAVVLAEHDGNGFLAACGQILADVVGTDGQLAVSAVHEDGQADDARAPEVHEGVHGGSDGPSREENVVHQHHREVL